MYCWVLHFRDSAVLKPPVFIKEQREIDLLVWKNGYLHPIEIKMTSNPNKGHIAAFSVLDKLNEPYKRGEGAVICCCDEPVSLTSSDKAVPVGYL